MFLVRGMVYQISTASAIRTNILPETSTTADQTQTLNSSMSVALGPRLSLLYRESGRLSLHHCSHTQIQQSVAHPGYSPLDMASAWPVPLTGRCGCGAFKYQLNHEPMFIHCCSCEQCQRETGSAFALNAMVEAEHLVTAPSNAELHPKLCLMASESGKGQVIARCPRCFVALWSYYPGAGPYIVFIRTGTLDKQGAEGQSIDHVLRPDVYIFTKHQQSWLNFPYELGKTFEGYYDKNNIWSTTLRERWQASRPRTQQWEARGGKWEELGNLC